MSLKFGSGWFGWVQFRVSPGILRCNHANVGERAPTHGHNRSALPRGSVLNSFEFSTLSAAMSELCLEFERLCTMHHDLIIHVSAMRLQANDAGQP